MPTLEELLAKRAAKAAAQAAASPQPLSNAELRAQIKAATAPAVAAATPAPAAPSATPTIFAPPDASLVTVISLSLWDKGPQKGNTSQYATKVELYTDTQPFTPGYNHRAQSWEGSAWEHRNAKVFDQWIGLYDREHPTWPAPHKARGMQMNKMMQALNAPEKDKTPCLGVCGIRGPRSGVKGTLLTWDVFTKVEIDAAGALVVTIYLPTGQPIVVPMRAIKNPSAKGPKHEGRFDPNKLWAKPKRFTKGP